MPNKGFLQCGLASWTRKLWTETVSLLRQGRKAAQQKAPTVTGNKRKQRNNVFSVWPTALFSGILDSIGYPDTTRSLIISLNGHLRTVTDVYRHFLP